MSKFAGGRGLLLALLAPVEPALAVPHLYTDVVLGVDDLRAWVDNASLPMALSISCSSQLGAASIAVAGMNNDDTFAAFQKVYDDF
ncbi:hypothetical protein [Cyanobium gracile]|uniref:Uncharacterized protein n=1 Tax=Cyanobium gracile (strain ATCC 27147 / PCC 6307) TaxID=292564 RepID=K9P7A2_CYAGP|nr:hypothetical protein [Cyanobium gracile]AFY28995.1 hypothetical protein Cyagr_1858 [Cyanobium gracile PCC 6307]